MYWLSEDEIAFPDPSLANEDGILAIGGDLSPKRLLLAYQIGVFPWFNPEDPILWWCPDPRFVLFPDELKVSKSMRPYFNQKKFTVTLDTCFEKVMKNCQQKERNGQNGTWITKEMLDAYIKLHQLGYAHSIEVWNAQNELVGGLYGVSLGACFFGESMFAHENNASKFGFITLVQLLKNKKFTLVDCQQQTNHLGSLGGRPIPREDFLNYLKQNWSSPTLKGSWTSWIK